MIITKCLSLLTINLTNRHLSRQPQFIKKLLSIYRLKTRKVATKLITINSLAVRGSNHPNNSCIISANTRQHRYLPKYQTMSSCSKTKTTTKHHRWLQSRTKFKCFKTRIRAHLGVLNMIIITTTVINYYSPVAISQSTEIKKKPRV